MRLSLADFDALTPDEFAAVYNAFERAHVREPWERARFVACSSLQPWSRRSLSVRDICHFAWDDDPTPDRQPHATASTRERFEEIVKRVKSKE